MIQWRQRYIDIIIIGGGPAGYTAAIYCGRAAMKTLLLENICPEDKMGITAHIDNYPGFPEGIDGFTFSNGYGKSRPSVFK